MQLPPLKKLRPFTPQYFQAATDALLENSRLSASVIRTVALMHKLINRAFEIEAQCAATDIGLVRMPKQAQPISLATKFSERHSRKTGFGKEYISEQQELGFVISNPQHATAIRIDASGQEMDSETQSLLGLVTMLQNCRNQAAGMWASARA